MPINDIFSVFEPVYYLARDNDGDVVPFMSSPSQQETALNELLDRPGLTPFFITQDRELAHLRLVCETLFRDPPGDRSTTYNLDTPTT